MRDYSWNANNEWKWISIIPDTLAKEVSVSHSHGGSYPALFVVIIPLESTTFVALHHEAAPLPSTAAL